MPRLKTNITLIIWQKSVICYFYVSYHLNYGLIYKVSKYRETDQPHHDTDSQNLEWGLHIDIKCMFPDFSWLFDDFQSFMTHIKIYWLFPVSLFPGVFLTCRNSVKNNNNKNNKILDLFQNSTRDIHSELQMDGRTDKRMDRRTSETGISLSASLGRVW